MGQVDFGLGSMQTGFEDDWGFQNDHGSFGGDMQGSRMFDFLSDGPGVSSGDGAQMMISSSKLHYFNQSVFPPLSEPVSPSSVETTPTSSEQPIGSAAGPRPTSNSSRYYEDSHEDLYKSSSSSCSRSAAQAAKRIRKVEGSSYSKSSSLGLNGDLGRKKKYDAPPGVWRNSGGFISTVYINKKRVYGPLRRDVNDAVRDREEMSIAKTYIRSEEGMRAFVSEMKTRSGPSREMCTDFSVYDSINEGGTEAGALPRGGAAKIGGSAAKYAGTNVVNVRGTDRPLRAAAKRNLYIASEDSPAVDEDTPEGYEIDSAAPFDNNGGVGFHFM